MALYINHAETERLARRLARATGATLTQAVQQALQERLRQLPRGDRRRRQARLAEILRRMDALPELDPRSETELLGYGADGLPH